MEHNKPSKKDRDFQYLMSVGLSGIKGPAYKVESIDINKKFLIICEGENTEPEYFKSFPVPTNIVEIHGGKNSKNSLVDYAIGLKNNKKYADREIWCVFDYDIKPDEQATQINDFNSSIKKAETNGLKVAWSNDCFELWFLLHDRYIDTCITRNEIYDILKKEWKLKSFDKEGKSIAFCKKLYEKHGGNQSKMQTFAIDYAKKLHNLHGKNQFFSKHCPCTTVYQLVEELNKYLKL